MAGLIDHKWTSVVQAPDLDQLGPRLRHALDAPVNDRATGIGILVPVGSVESELDSANIDPSEVIVLNANFAPHVVGVPRRRCGGMVDKHHYRS